VAELQRSVLAKRKTITEHGRWRLRDVQKHVELYDVYQSLSIARGGEFFHRAL